MASRVAPVGRLRVRMRTRRRRQNDDWFRNRRQNDDWWRIRRNDDDDDLWRRNARCGDTRRVVGQRARACLGKYDAEKRASDEGEQNCKNDEDHGAVFLLFG